MAWRQLAQELDTPEIKALADALTNPDVTYPDYYRVPFHAYDEGNLCWQARLRSSASNLLHGTAGLAPRIPHLGGGPAAVKEQLSSGFRCPRPRPACATF